MHTECTLEVATPQETGRRRAKIAQAWAKELKGLLLEMKASVEQARAAGLQSLPSAIREALVTRYRALFALGHAANPPPERRPRQRGRVKRSPARNLLERQWLGQDEVLAFLDDFAIPFDDDQAERDLRTLKTQQKVSGCFRGDSARMPSHGCAAIWQWSGPPGGYARPGCTVAHVRWRVRIGQR